MSVNYFRSLIPSIFILILLVITSCAKEQSENEEEEEMFTGLEGKYLGGWTSTTESTSFTDFPVSAIFRYTDSNQNKIKGEFFATGGYASCCALDDDGTITFDIDGTEIKNFNFVDRIVNCEGNFRGSGVIENDSKLIIDFTGNDCDGNHIGVLTFSKQ